VKRCLPKKWFYKMVQVSILLSGISLLFACGQKGALYLPDEPSESSFTGLVIFEGETRLMFVEV